MSYFVFRPSTRGRTSRFYSAKIKIEGWPRPRVFALRVSEKDIANEKARALSHDLEREALGLPSFVSLRKAAASPIAPHLAAFLSDVEARGGAPATLRVYRVVLGQLVRCCSWSTPGRISVSSFNQWRAETGASAKYAKNALGYARTFCRWLVKRRVLAVDPFADVEIRLREGRGCRFVPGVESLNAFLQAAPASRAVVYLVAIYTGLRRCELNGLTWGDFDLDAETPSVLVPGSISKNTKTERLPLRSEVVSALRRFRPEACQPFEWVFRGRVPNMRTFRRDAAAAGIPPTDEYGRKFDFHALRTAYGTLLSASGVSPRVAMQLMRHSDIKLTMKTYTDAAHLPLVQGVASLPSLGLAEVKGGETHTSKHVSNAVISGQNGSISVVECPRLDVG